MNQLKQTMPFLILFMLCLSSISIGHSQEDATPIKVTPTKVAQLIRLEPLTKPKLDVLVAAGQLSRAQADLITKWIQADGSLTLPEVNIGAESIKAPETPEPTSFQNPDGSLNVLAYIQNEDRNAVSKISQAQAERLTIKLRGYIRAGRGQRLAMRKELLAMGADANGIISKTFLEPIDMIYKLQLWGGIARAKNPRAAGYIARTHQDVMNEASPVLVPYAKDIGGLILRRTHGGQHPLQRWYTSRELREIVIDLERLISQCSGVRAASYLIDVYAARYESSEAPMRDKKRDRLRMVHACGGNKKHFDQDEPDKWGCSLRGLERAMVAERLVDALQSKSESLRQIAMNGLMIVLKSSDKKLKKRLEKAHKNWPAFQRWYAKQRSRLLESQ